MGKCTPITRILPASVAWILLLCATGIFFAFPCRYLMSVYSIGIPIFQGVITFFVIINFALATFVNPGIIPKAQPDELKGDGISPTYKDIEINGIKVRLKWCVTCQFYRPPRCVHCGVCDNCIETFDHHCPWVNNCIGRRNYRYFFLFLFWLSIHMISILCLCSFYLKDHLDNIKRLTTLMTLGIIALIIILFIPILGLTIYHLMLIIRGKTTNEQVTGKFSKDKNPYSRGCCKNMLYTLCNSPLPRFKSDGTFYSLSNRYSSRSLKEQTFHESQSSNSLKASSVHFTYSDKNDFMIPNQTLSTDCESSPPSYLNRESLHLSLSESLYTRPESHSKNRSSRALTPPVPIRFDCSRRSLPPHNRLHAPSPHYVVAQSIHSPPFTKDVSRMSACTSGQSSNPTLYCSQSQNPSFMKYDYGATSADACAPNSNYYSNVYNKRKDMFSKPEGISFTSPESASSGKMLASDTCCLGNQTVDKLQEIANRTMIGGQCTDVSVLEAFPKGCSSFHNSPNKEHYDGHQLLIAHTPQQLYVNNCVDCQQSSSNHSCQSSVSGEFARTPGNRPLSFVKAMEMSETMDLSDCDLQHPRFHVSQHSRLTQNLSPSYKVVAPNANVVPDYKTRKSDPDVSYEISV
ncbi:palmitoyltransferase ZDHHC5-A isoform X1 [Parasteatoda tepidariorum]|uniref:palmitoyltransferase ZDHHC5-A isoform X1 n=1 Tax=Parasteatoda tepidariorum TaxID=114398 RepID=UPI00077FC59A|nr:palmitoyltransferase ZDHHC5-A isoform X1 [Parasteatoda tepidariorum]